jgi:hypothetical protein
MTATRIPPRRTATRRAPGRPAFQEPLIESPDKPATAKGPAAVKADKAPPAVAEQRHPERPSEHNGVAVAREELQSNLPNGAVFKISRLHLVDGTAAYACRDCSFTGDGRVDVQQHRNAEHGKRYGKKAPRVIFEKDRQVGDLVLPPRRDDTPAPTNPMEMTLAEFLSLAPSFAALSDLIDRTERERDAALAAIREMREENKDAAHAMAVYPSLQEEVVNLRLLVRHAGPYEEMKTELLQLRAWKKKMIQRLEPLGFVLTDEDNKEQ